jgi:hypothetical protein
VAGASASASHTAAIAGDALVTDQLARGAGVVMAETLEGFDDLLRTFVRLDGRAVRGRRLAAISNAGFECVAIADNLGRLQPARFGTATGRRPSSTSTTRSTSRRWVMTRPLRRSPRRSWPTRASTSG